MEILATLLGGEAKVKVMRLFLFGEQNPYDFKTIVERANITAKEARAEIGVLTKIGLIKEKHFVREISKKKGKKDVVEKQKANGWVLDERFPYLNAVKNLLITVSLQKHEELPDRFDKAGKIKLLLVSGVFIQDWESRVDLLIVGDSLRFGAIEKTIKTLESEIGKELRYSIFETADFEYRLGIYDKLVRDIIDFPHIKVVDKLGIA